jgi:multidrug efflux pump subunit AcrB
MGGSINTMLLGGLALVFSRLIDNGVIVLENIFRHMEMGKSPQLAADEGGTEVAMAVLAATFTTAIVFFPVTSFSGVSKYIFTPLALGVVLSIFASYLIRHDRGAALLRQVHSPGSARQRTRGRLTQLKGASRVSSNAS